MAATASGNAIPDHASSPTMVASVPPSPPGRKLTAPASMPTAYTKKENVHGAGWPSQPSSRWNAHASHAQAINASAVTGSSTPGRWQAWAARATPSARCAARATRDADCAARACSRSSVSPAQSRADSATHAPSEMPTSGHSPGWPASPTHAMATIAVRSDSRSLTKAAMPAV